MGVRLSCGGLASRVLLVGAVAACKAEHAPTPPPPGPPQTTPRPAASSAWPPAASASATNGVRSDFVIGAMLAGHLEDAKRSVSHATIGRDRVWTDEAILERAPDLPEPIADHLRKSPEGRRDGKAMLDLVERMEAELPHAHEARLVRESGAEHGCRYEGGGISARTNCVYATYLEARYPSARYFVTGAYAPVIVVSSSSIRALLMPVK
ncbi:MAG: hypothetical protein JST00_32890 [Deltaproteobacteria bacterium]|nr:hypothetical protein [Deltaproteobacteria bacterium]